MRCNISIFNLLHAQSLSRPYLWNSLKQHTISMTKYHTKSLSYMRHCLCSLVHIMTISLYPCSLIIRSENRDMSAFFFQWSFVAPVKASRCDVGFCLSTSFSECQHLRRPWCSSPFLKKKKKKNKKKKKTITPAVILSSVHFFL